MPGEAAFGGLRNCVFCGIADGREEAFFFQSDGGIKPVYSRRGEDALPWSDATPDVFVFENQFLFYDLTSLVIPSWHSERVGPRYYLQQSELWQDLGAAGRTARDHGQRWI